MNKSFLDYSTIDGLININLENIYKEASRHSHEYALECIFEEGVKRANKTFQIDGDEYAKIKEKYEALLAKVSQNAAPSDPDVQLKVISQTLNMGKTFMTGATNGRQS